MNNLKKLATSLFLVLLLAACGSVAPPAPPPKLVVFFVVDGLPQRQVTGYRDQLAPDGLARFLDRGVAFSEAHYAHAFTVTAAGHATLLTGASPARHGIIGNEWRDPATGAEVYCTGDTAATYIGNATKPLDGTSPRNLKVETLGDVMRRVDPRAKVIGISGKDRGAILPAGHAGTAYMYMSGSGQFASTTYYMPRHPAWVEAFNAEKRADRYRGTEWKPLLPDAAYARSLPFNQVGPKAQLPLRTDDYAALLRSPFADALSLDFARAAIAAEQLGRDDVPDLLVVSLSGHDYVNHAFSAESRFSQDHLLQLDRLLQDFFRDLDATVGRDNYVAVLSADHGFTPAPETSKARGQEGGRIEGAKMLQQVNAQLESRFGVPKLVLGSSASSLVLDKALLAQRGLAADTVAAAARDVLAAQDGIAVAYTRRELESGGRAGSPFFDAMQRSFNRERSGDVQYATRPGWMFGTSTATHGSPHEADTHVPILLWGPRWMKAQAVATPVQTVDIAPTLARLLGVPAPAASEGKLLPLAAP
ncbi:alkaline phosphatase family protein [Ramlibacter sp. XY19]|uniref:alkaline phosphatase family protein n=1 Tax=Ramlibacter paludis TaxID=2908000 RepID=UPI0023DC4CA0|nr:alkaline phosphatase family protein [Ramlibacter paludis]MCG2592695.1 alkaline phosphatase family protein [Ramlibacter paludis]